MNCREFRRKHDAYIDDTLSGVDIDGMTHHRRLCESCAQLDTRVRRALLLARNLPTIEPSSDFATRLQARIAQERVTLQVTRLRESGEMMIHVRPLSPVTYAIIMAGVIAAAGLAGAATRIRANEDAILLTPVVASTPESEGIGSLERATLATPTMVAAMPQVVPVWPAGGAEQVQWHFASDSIRH